MSKADSIVIFFLFNAISLTRQRGLFPAVRSRRKLDIRLFGVVFPVFNAFASV
jgi:hypothetical protein